MSGTYTLSGSTATLYSGSDKFGTAVLNGTTLTVTLANPSYGGPYTFTKSGSNSGNNGDNGSSSDSIAGTYTGAPGTLIVTATTWTLSGMSGTYTQSGSTATLRSGGTTIGTAVLSGNNLTVTLNAASGAAGTYYFTKSGSSSSSGSGNIAGTYTGTIKGASATLILTTNSWILTVPLGGVNDTGTYSLTSSTTGTIYYGSTNIGSATLNGNTLTLLLNSNSDTPGTYYFTKK
jgi:hypothetical protein